MSIPMNTGSWLTLAPNRRLIQVPVQAANESR
jgi:hypothetical protein